MSDNGILPGIVLFVMLSRTNHSPAKARPRPGKANSQPHDNIMGTSWNIISTSWNIKLVPNWATRVCCGNVFYPGGFWAVVLLRLPQVLVLLLLGCCNAQVPPGICLALAGPWVCSSFPRFWSCLSCVVVIQSLCFAVGVLFTGSLWPLSFLC